MAPGANAADPSSPQGTLKGGGPEVRSVPGERFEFPNAIAPRFHGDQARPAPVAPPIECGSVPTELGVLGRLSRRYEAAHRLEIDALNIVQIHRIGQMVKYISENYFS